MQPQIGRGRGSLYPNISGPISQGSTFPLLPSGMKPMNGQIPHLGTFPMPSFSQMGQPPIIGQIPIMGPMPSFSQMRQPPMIPMMRSLPQMGMGMQPMGQISQLGSPWQLNQIPPSLPFMHPTQIPINGLQNLATFPPQLSPPQNNPPKKEEELEDWW